MMKFIFIDLHLLTFHKEHFVYSYQDAISGAYCMDKYLLADQL